MHMLNQWVSGILGLAVVVVPFLTLSQMTLTWTLVALGLAIAASGFWGMLSEPTEHRTHHAGSHA